MKRSYKLRTYLSKTQQADINRLFGARRWAYNNFVEAKKQDTSWNLSKASKALTALKQADPTAWQHEVRVDLFTQAFRDADKAFKAWGKPDGKGDVFGEPSFARFTDSTQSFRVQMQNERQPKIYQNGKRFMLPHLGNMKVRWHKHAPNQKPKMVTLKKSANGRFHLSFLIEAKQPVVRKTGRQIGIDVGGKLDNLVVTSDGQRFAIPEREAHLIRRLKSAQRKLSRKEALRKKENRKKSNSHKRAQLEVAKIHAKRTNLRDDFLHKLSTNLVLNNDVICIEHLNIAGMKKNKNLGSAIHRAGWGKFFAMLDYKCKFNDKELVRVGRFFASSQAKPHDVALA